MQFNIDSIGERCIFLILDYLREIIKKDKKTKKYDFSELIRVNRSLYIRVSNYIYHRKCVSERQLKAKLTDNDITDLSVLNNYSNYYELNLTGCQRFIDVSMLGKVHTLNLRYCNKITDVSTLGNVHTLDLYDCDEITDVSMLRNVKKLFR